MSADKPVLCVLEPQVTGHRLHYVSLFVDAGTVAGLDVVIATTNESARGHQFGAMKSQLVGARIVSLPGLGPGAERNLFRRQLMYRRLLQDLHRAARKPDSSRAELVIVPCIDDFFLAAALRAPFSQAHWQGVLVRATFLLRQANHRSLKDRIKGTLFKQLLHQRSLQRIFFIDPRLEDDTLGVRSYARGKVHYMPDPAHLEDLLPRSTARERLGLPKNGRTVLVYGSLTSRKGIQFLIRGLEAAAVEMSLIIAGPPDRYVRGLLNSATLRGLRDRGCVAILDKFLDASEEALVFSAADVGWLGYEDHDASSGVLVQCALAGVPILSTREGLLGELTQKHGLGLTVDVRSSEQVADALDTLCGDEVLRGKLIENSKRFALKHERQSVVELLAKELSNSCFGHERTEAG